MRKRSAFGIAVLACLLVLATAAPAHAAPRHLRLYRGETSQGERISFVVARTDAGRFVREMDYGVTFTCEDQSTQDWGIGWGLGHSLPIIDRVFSFDEALSDQATHIGGELGKLQGSGTMTITIAALTSDEQAQLCTTGDLTWTVEFIRRL